MDDKFHANGKRAQKTVLTKELSEQIAQIKESSHLSKSEQEDKIEKLRSKYQNKINELTINFY